MWGMDWQEPTEETLDKLPATGGAYALRFDVHKRLTLPINRLGHPRLDPGDYVYCGSAYGPGGLRARLQRHLRKAKKPHWHIDHLTARAPVCAITWLEGGRECHLVDQLLAEGATTPVAGFGSSDCRHCQAHLVRL